MKSRNNTKPKSIAPPADLLVCFPARARLTLLPKPTCSPARASAEPHRRHQKKAPPPSQSQASPLLWAKEMASEPTSPKVTCAGQIKIKPHARRSTKNWQSVMEEIERIHKKKKIPNWGNQIQDQNPFGFKREIVNFLSCLRGFRFDFRCFRGFPESDDITTEEEDEEEYESEPESEAEYEEAHTEATSKRRTMFSKWFMVLQDEEEEEEETKPRNDTGELQPCSVPPPNALLLMRCRSAPSTGWIERKPKQEQQEQEQEEKQSKISLKLLMEEEKEAVAKKESLVVMDYDADFYKLSSDIAKETWVVSGSSTSRCNDDPFLRSRSWKR
ncbi:uncharacterized protein LOC111805493 [Cucurbita pepo subsp. pepo]|uniref:uncharacterized protein LOC111805493 n=1 Tax=Cucurbita pepo subsp. pepo TaxID=3664 RepID=UPI000C9D28BC|nr:uncharacterized protein LOC111805493 [Cucurbita pepo subsp. pepo]